MEYTISLSENKDFVIAKYVGNIEGDDALTAAVETHAFAKQHDLFCVLVDAVESINCESTIKKYDFAYDDILDERIDKRMCVALLVAPDDHSHDFVETLMRNTGHDVTLFRDLKEAIAHLHASGKYA